MRKLLLLIALFAVTAHAQFPSGTPTNPVGANLIVQDAGSCSTTGSYLWQKLPNNALTTTVNLSGTFSGTVTVRESNNGGGVWTSAGTQSAAGTVTYQTNGFTDICADVTTYSSGSIGITITTGTGGPNAQYVIGSTNTGGLSNPGATLIPSTGVKADAKFVRDATWTNTSTAVSCPNNDCNFSASADAGKVCFGVDPVTQLATLPFGNLTVTGAQTATCSVAATGSKVANGNFAWGTDDTTAHLAAQALMYASVSPACVQLPNGMSIVTKAQFVDPRTSPQWQICAVVNGFFQFIPAGNAFDWTTANGATGAAFWDPKNGGIPQDNMPQYNKLDNYGVQGLQLDLCPASAASKNIVTFQRVEGRNIWIWDWCRNATNASVNGINWVSPNSLYNANVQAGNVGINAVGSGSNAMNFIQSSYCGGTVPTCMVVNNGAIVVDKGGFWLGCTTQCIKTLAGSILYMDGDQLNGSSGNQYIDIAGFASIRNINMIATNNSGSAILTRATGQVKIEDSFVSETGTSGVAFNTQTVPGGSIWNMGGNTVVGTDQTTLANSGVVLSAGWGTTATTTNAAGNWRRFTFQANSSGTGQAASPTMTITFPVPWQATPTGLTCKQVGGTGALTVVSGESGATTTSVALTFNGTPAAGSNYIFNCVVEI